MTRLEKVRKKMAGKKITLLIVTDLSNIRYLVGYSGSFALLAITHDEAFLATDFRYKSQVRKEVKGAKPVIVKKGLFSLFDEVTKLKRFKYVGFEKMNINYLSYKWIRKLFPKAKKIETENLIEELRFVKDTGEIKKINQASRIAEQALIDTIPFIKPGVTELEVAAELEYRMKKGGGEYPAFNTIVASGPNSALPHARASSKKLKKGELLVIDYGTVYDGYHCDITRTFVLGKANKWQREIYNITLEAQLKAIKAAKAGIKSPDLDAAARDYINGKGYGDKFGHSLGHGIGLVVHDGPRVSSMGKNEMEENMVVTIEPGIYLEGKGGVRIEDDVVIKKSSCQVITRLPKTLEEMELSI
ncbi:aminopeptidase P family protein [bacterium]|nr:aminopeptidase P family protein [bacterium]